MKTLEFYQADQETKFEIQASLYSWFNIASYELPEWLQKFDFNETTTWSEAFNIKLVCYDDGTLVDYKIFDPFHKHFNGYTDHNGWSHWQNDAFAYLTNQEQNEVQQLIEEEIF